MKFTSFKQGTKEWLAWRRKGVTSTDSAIINGTNTFNGNSPFKLWQRKMEILDEEEENILMQEGNELEVDALECFNKKQKTKFVKPNGGYHDEYEWMLASLDGYDKNSDYILEIKCGLSTYKKAQDQVIPLYYLDQIQHSLFVSDKKKCYYLAYRPDENPIILTVERDDKHIKNLFKKDQDFYDCMLKLVPPPLLEVEYVQIKDPSATEMAIKWREAKEKLKIYEKMEKEAKEALLEHTDGGNCIFPDANVKVQARIKKGAVDYSKILKDHGIEKHIIEKYRKAESTWLQPLIVKEA